DRKNDWLAKQLLEEKLAQIRIAAMFDLKYSAKAEHEKHCDAAELKKDHAKKCDAKAVDRAKGK
ncbi:MAG TPA: hypothetical protein DCL38_10265, partial [Lachnospiraceae bacterium]|nr:hypothetical protein [Lachnospiraceae bacterium]